MPTSGHMEDGTPWVCIGADEPEAERYMVHCECSQCGQDHWFDLWAMFRGEEITCEHCGHVSRATRTRLDA